MYLRAYISTNILHPGGSRHSADTQGPRGWGKLTGEVRVYLTDRQTDGQTDRQADALSDRDRQTDRQTDR
eukprot:6504729-Pyramimonas_sp.AAC.1